LLIFGKVAPVFLGYDLVFDPHAKLTALARNEVYFGEAEFLLEQVRHTGGARQVVSNDAVANGDAFHLLSSPSKRVEASAKAGSELIRQLLSFTFSL
jgi:hypothetical protein